MSALPPTWTPDNGNGTFTNPLFYDEFSDPDLIRVGNDFYLTGTTMHTMPGLPMLHSQDLVNWELLGYVFERLDLGADFRLQDGQEIYGQGIWAPCLRYHNGLFHIFTNVNRHATQHFFAANPAGPWTRREMNGSFHDLSVLFDDDGKVYILWGYQGLNFAELNDDLSDIRLETRRVLIQPEAGMGEGVHFYKINGTYFITSAWFAGRMRMPCARSAHPAGPYEVNLEISADEDFGLAEGLRLVPTPTDPFATLPSNPTGMGRMSLHQGGVVDTPSGEWWGFSMMDYNSVGRLTCLSPVTWQDGWPYFGLPGNLGRSPRTWTKPNTASVTPPSAPFARSDDFNGPRLNPLWQWNHVPDERFWSVGGGNLRLKSLPALDFWHACNTLTQRAIGPLSSATVMLDGAAMQPGDTAGLALLNYPYTWLGLVYSADGLMLEWVDQRTENRPRIPAPAQRLWLRVSCDFLRERAEFSYSRDGQNYEPFGPSFDLVFQLKTFQGVRYALFHYNSLGQAGGQAGFSHFCVEQPHPRGLMRPIPYGQEITLTTLADGSSMTADNGPFRVIERELGRVALQTRGGAWLSVQAPGAPDQVSLRAGNPDGSETFQWMETP
jgi:xylan 1,4-beta-xylosidase